MSAAARSLPAPARHLSPAPVPAPADVQRLNWLRLLFRSCRAKARLDLFQACALLGVERPDSAQLYADALLRALSARSARALVLNPPGTATLGFDERWLLSLLAAIARGDEPSRDFLLRSRVPQADRRAIGWLATRLVALAPDGDT